MASPVHPYSDYGVALRTLRSARSWLGFLLFACILAQLIGFVILRYSTQPYKHFKPAEEVTTATGFDRLARYITEMRRSMAERDPAAASQPALEPSPEELTIESPQTRRLNIRAQWATSYALAVPATQVLGLLAAVSQTIIIFVSLLLILVAQGPGVAQVTRSLICAVLLLFCVLPWQYFGQGFPLPGVLYSWHEMLRMISPIMLADAAHPLHWWQPLLLYGRFFAWPAVVLLLLLMTAERFRAGLMLAIGHPLQSMMAPRPANGPTPPAAARPMDPIPLSDRA